ncbi:hypothetical protein ACFX1Q_039178 [Malus domestica]|uniref:ninja-family protein Os03g0419100-like n=1 Tax=Malus domestica TaxID=3750 RepID=UPI000498B12C|nr:ninja-family protein Os03g0419100-like [Malus domestica]
MAAANRDNLSQPHNAAMLNNIADSQIPDLNLEFSLGGIYSENSNQSPLDRFSTEAKVLRLQEPQTTPQMAAAPVRSIRRPRARSLPKEPRLRRPIRPKDVLASRRRETKQKIAQRQMSQQLAALPEVARAVAAPAAPTALAVCSASRASIGAGASDTVYHYKEEGYFTVSRAAEGAISVQTLHSQRDVTPIASSATATTTKQAVPSQSTPENPSKRVKHSSGSVPQNDGDEMVSVRTTGEGGRQIEGILYARNGQVQILCVCHGIYHSPAEFIKHGGGKEVANPLKHIIVRPSSD